MLVPNRNFSSPEYRYGFNGMEKDDNIKGSGNSYNFGARMYDPRVGRWFSVDGLEKNYPDLSPYAYVGNNPILFIDYDGNDFGIKVNHKNKTITIIADIYTTEEDIAILNQAVTKWNDLSGQYYYKTKNSQGKYDYYEIKFDIEAKQAKTHDTKENLKNSNPQVRRELMHQVNQKEIKNGNSFLFVDDSKDPFIKKTKKGKIIEMDNRGAATKTNKFIYGRSSQRSNIPRIVHEIAHILGVGNIHIASTYTAESEKVLDNEGNEMPGGMEEKFIIENIEQIFKTAGLGFKKRYKKQIKKGKKRDIVNPDQNFGTLNKKGTIISKEKKDKETLKNRI